MGDVVIAVGELPIVDKGGVVVSVVVVVIVGMMVPLLIYNDAERILMLMKNSNCRNVQMSGLLYPAIDLYIKIF